jgi:hypothetical protein
MSAQRTLIRSTCLALPIAVLAFVGYGSAAPPDAAQLKSEIAAAIEDLGGGGKDRVIVYDKLEVTPDGDAFRVMVNGLAFRSDPDTVLFGDVGFRIKPDADGNYAVDDLSLPTEFKGGPKDDVVVAHLPKVAFTGLWSPQLASFIDADASIEKLAISDSKDKATVDTVTFKLVSAEKAKGRWDQSMKLVIDGVHFAGEQTKLFSLGELAIGSETTNFDLVAWADLQRRLKAAGRTEQPLDAATMKQLAEIGSIVGASKGTIRIADLSVQDESEHWSFALPTATLSGGVSGLDQPLSGITLDLAYEGVQLSTGAKESDDLALALAPNRVSLALALEDLPTKEFFGGLVALMTQEQQAKEDKRSQLAMEFAGAMQGAITVAGSKFRIGPSVIDSKLVKTKVEGLAQASGTAALGGVAVVKFDIIGLDAAIKAAKAAFGPNDADSAKALDVLRLVSERHKETDGTVVDHYTFSLSPEGDMKINDKPIDSLFQ